MLKCPIPLTRYNSIHTIDIIFGSTRTTTSSQWTCNSLVHPLDHHSTLEAIHWAQMMVKVKAKANTTLIGNHKVKVWTHQQLPLTHYPNIHILSTILPHTIIQPHPKWPKYYHYFEQSLTSIIYIYNQYSPLWKIHNFEQL